MRSRIKNTLILLVTIFIFAALIYAKATAQIGAILSVSATVRAGVCGDGIIEIKEECEDQQFVNHKSCLSYGFLEGELKCNTACQIDFSNCYNPKQFQIPTSTFYYFMHTFPQDGRKIDKTEEIKYNALER